MSWIGAAVGVSSLITGMMNANAISDASNAQSQAAQNANNLQWGMYQQNQTNLQPYMQAGQGSAQGLADWNAPGGQGSQQFNYQDYMNTPGYNFQLQQGQQALDRSMAARGVGVSTGEMQAQQQFGTGLAAQGYQQAFGNFQTSQQNRFNQLASVAGMGENAAAQQGNNGLQTANIMGNNTMNAANGQGGAAIANANNWNSTLNTGINAMTNGYYNGGWGQPPAMANAQTSYTPESFNSITPTDTSGYPSFIPAVVP